PCVESIGRAAWLTVASSVVPLPGDYLAPEYIVGPRRIHEYERNDEQGANQRKPLAFGGARGVPNADVRRNDLGPHADAKSAIAKKHECESQQKRRNMGI